ncbi:MAG: phosphatase PAP2 family protein [Patescibacteria group bacterium]
MLVNFDQQVFIWITENRSILGTAIFSFFSFLGNWQFVILFLLVIVVILIVKKKFSFIVPLLLSVLGSAALTFLGKLYCQRPRPSISVFAETGYSFPSSHATVAASLWLFLAFMMAGKGSKMFYIIALFLIILIGFSRIYLGAHYVSDVLAGYLVGFLGFMIGVILFERRAGNK